MTRRERKQPWYAAGLRFRCTACGQCCTGEPGHVWVTEDEILRMAQRLKLSRRAFEERYVRRVGSRVSLREQPGGDCVMLKDGRCQVYADKPQPCSTFPFWTGALRTPETWEDARSRCEGIDQGDLYSADEIERICAGDASLLLERHSRPPERPVVSRFENGRALAPSAEAARVQPVQAPAPAQPDWDGALEALQELYAELERELPRWGFTCSASGACCDFDAYGHRLYVTALEAAWFFAQVPQRANADARHCPAWGPDRLCKSRAGRMLGCRIYFCPPYPRGTPEDLYARYFERVRELHQRYAIPYAYKDIVEWAREHLPASPQAPPRDAGPAPAS